MTILLLNHSKRLQNSHFDNKKIEKYYRTHNCMCDTYNLYVCVCVRYFFNRRMFQKKNVSEEEEERRRKKKKKKKTKERKKKEYF